MNPTNTNTLFSRYPRLYEDRHQFRMCWGFACGDGWFRLIDQLSADIEAQCNRLRSEEGLPERALPIAYEVRESFGELRFRVRSRNWDWGFCRVGELIDSLIERAVVESRSTCSQCGRCYRAGAERTGREWQAPCTQCHGRISPADRYSPA